MTEADSYDIRQTDMREIDRYDRNRKLWYRKTKMTETDRCGQRQTVMT